MNTELMWTTTASIVKLRDQLISVMAELPSRKDPIIQQILETVTVLRDLATRGPKFDGVHVTA